MMFNNVFRLLMVVVMSATGVSCSSGSGQQWTELAAKVLVRHQVINVDDAEDLKAGGRLLFAPYSAKGDK